MALLVVLLQTRGLARIGGQEYGSYTAELCRAPWQWFLRCVQTYDFEVSVMRPTVSPRPAGSTPRLAPPHLPHPSLPPPPPPPPPPLDGFWLPSTCRPVAMTANPP